MTGYPQQVLRRLQLTELEILDVVSEFCSKHQITWWLDSGTTLGAIRHEGFIPWDDDIDIGMVREDYDRFIALAETQLPAGYSLHTPQNTDRYPPMFAKVYKDGTRFLTRETIDARGQQGIFIDVFPFDRLSMDPNTRKRQIARARRWQRFSYLYHSRNVIIPGRSPLVRTIQRSACIVLHGALHILSSEDRIKRRYRSVEDWSRSLASSEYLPLAYPYNDPFPYEVLLPTRPCNFEGRKLPVPGKAEEYLVLMYGDTWSELPPPEQRKTHAPLVLDFGDGTNALETPEKGD